MAAEDEKAESGVPRAMVDQAEAAAAGVQDVDGMTPAERRHVGHDVAVADPSEAEHDIYDTPPPAYGDHYGDISCEQQGFGTSATVGDDGRVNIRIDQKSQKVSGMLAPSLRLLQEASQREPLSVPPSLAGLKDLPPPRMSVVIQVVGSRGDVQPFIALGKVLKDKYGHRVRLATHPNFQDFVIDNGLEFFSIGGDPAALMAFMVKNPGLMPGFDSLRAGEVGKRRKEVGEYLKGCWRSCFETGDGLGPEATNDTVEDYTTHRSGEPSYLSTPFVADCIIANPPSFAHVHCAEKMGIPLHVMFTMPYSPTQAFPHPLANIQHSNAEASLTNYISYTLIDILTWQGLGDIINRFRQKSLGLEPISLMWAPQMFQRLRIPHTYCWSPALIEKPKDWGHHISISGFFFLDLASNYTPDPELKEFLDAGPPPVYIGFGSIVLDDPNAMTELLFEAVRKSGQRALVSKGWGGMGADEFAKPDGVFMLGNVPHDWLFKQVSCVVHHGGAGTTAAGITAGKPTVIVPFFGDQAFWGTMVSKAGAGPEPIHNKELTSDNLAAAIKKCLEPESQERAKDMASKIAEERGTEVGAQKFHQFLNVDDLRCNLAPNHSAVWRVKRTQVKLSALAACTLANEGLLDFKDIKLYRPKEYETDDGPWDPITGATTALVGTMSAMMLGVADFPIETLKALKIHPDSTKAGQSSSSGKASTASVHSEDPTPSKGSSISTASGQASDDTSVQPSSSSMTTSNDSASTFNLEESMAKLHASPISRGQSFSRTDSAANSTHEASQGGEDTSQKPSTSQTKSSGKAISSPQDAIQTGIETGKGVQRIVSAGLKSPMDFTVSLAKGFRNAPKLYGDDTVRKPDQITDFKSGIRAATKEFGYGMYDGITGLVTQPAMGAKKEGAAGFFKGIGKGIGGVVFKPGAAIWGIPGYTMKGIYREMAKLSGSSVQNYIIAARTAEGFAAWQKASEDERADIIEKWTTLQQNLKKKQNPDEVMREFLAGGFHKKDQKTHTKGKKDAKTSTAEKSSTARSAAANVDDDDDDDEDLKRAMAESAAEVERSKQAAATHDKEMEWALNESKKHDPGHVAGTTQEEFEQQQKQQPGEKTQQEKTEEQIVLEYILKQSAVEEQHRRKLATDKSQPQATAAKYDDDGNDEELQQAMKISMQDNNP